MTAVIFVHLYTHSTFRNIVLEMYLCFSKTSIFLSIFFCLLLLTKSSRDVSTHKGTHSTCRRLCCVVPRRRVGVGTAHPGRRQCGCSPSSPGDLERISEQTNLTKVHLFSTALYHARKILSSASDERLLPTGAGCSRCPPNSLGSPPLTRWWGGIYSQ